MVVIAILAALIFLVSLISHRLERTIITPPMIFTAAGILLFLAFPEELAAPLSLKPVLTVTEIALAIVLFTDGTRIRIRELIGVAYLPGRLLVIGMPLIILAGTVVAALMFTDLSIWEAAILAAVLAPTDAGLGHAIISSELVPIRIRQALNIEAGLNDGLAIPFLMLFIALARVDSPLTDRSWIVYLMQEIGLGIVYGALFGLIGGWLIGQAKKRHWMSEGLQQLTLLSIAVLAWVVIEFTAGNSFIGAFVCGLLIKYGYESAGEQMVDFSDVWGQLFNMIVFAIFGSIVAPIIGNFGFMIVLYAVLSLTVIRIVPVLVSFIGEKLQRSTVLFMGWFGPRGLASIVLGLIYLKQEANLAGEATISLLISATVLLSIFAHGISAAPGIKLYNKQVEKLPPDAPECQDAVRMPVR
jgi:NhaP-type Na+/H+ or K+/H+ antiporter